MKISIKHLSFQTILGILEHERVSPQTVSLHVSLWYAWDGTSFINYADVYSLLQTRMQSKNYFLIEDALKDLSSEILETYPQARKIKIKISKPDILPNALVGVSHTEKRTKIKI